MFKNRKRNIIAITLAILIGLWVSATMAGNAPLKKSKAQNYKPPKITTTTNSVDLEIVYVIVWSNPSGGPSLGAYITNKGPGYAKGTEVCAKIFTKSGQVLSDCKSMDYQWGPMEPNETRHFGFFAENGEKAFLNVKAGPNNVESNTGNNKCRVKIKKPTKRGKNKYSVDCHGHAP